MSILVETLTNGNSHSFQDNSGDSHHYNGNAPTGQAVEEKLAATGSGERTQKTLAQRLHEAVDVISKLYPEIQIVPVSGKSPKCGNNWQQKKLSYDLIHDLISGKVKITSDYKDGKKVPGSEKLVKLTYFQRQAQYRCWFGDYRTNRVTGIGIRTGEVSEGLLTVDGDGFEALKLIEAHGGFPLTPSWTSGKPGRRSYLFRVPQEHWAFIQNTKGVKVGDSGDAIEFLWNGSQCVVPPSLYPNGYPTTSQWKKNKETGNLEWVTQENPGYIEGLDFYRWIDDIKTTPIAEAPQWVIEMMNK